MHLDRGIVCMYIRSYGQSTRPDDQNTFTRKSTGTRYAPRYLIHDLITRSIDPKQLIMAYSIGIIIKV